MNKISFFSDYFFFLLFIYILIIIDLIIKLIFLEWSIGFFLPCYYLLQGLSYGHSTFIVHFFFITITFLINYIIVIYLID